MNYLIRTKSEMRLRNLSPEVGSGSDSEMECKGELSEPGCWAHEATNE